MSGARTKVALGGSHFSVIVSCKCVRAVLWHYSRRGHAIMRFTAQVSLRATARDA